MMQAKTWIQVSAGLLMLAVLLGAFGAHALKGMVTAERLAVFHTGVQYQVYHALGLLVLSIWAHLKPEINLTGVREWLFAGVMLFSGSLYALVLLDMGWLGAVTPLGGVSFVLGWGLLIWRMRHLV
jgi:uncharacterized membrane protein YgdD (TMEM256/DUF423 family)